VPWTFTHKRWRLQALPVATRGRGGTWVKREELGDYAMSGAQRALLDALARAAA
jgi:hypothetical protein